MRTFLEVAVPLALFLLGTIVPPISQDQSYHQFADQRKILGIANFWNTISNLPFLITGWIGLRTFRETRRRVLFIGVLLVAIGSGYYHLAPSDATLVWDRLPMTIAFMALVAIVIPSSDTGFATLLLFGFASVIWWKLNDNLWPYGFAQFGAIFVVVIQMIRGPARSLWPAMLLYGLAKAAEFYDAPIYSHFPLSGHTLKHLLAAGSTYWIYRAFARPR